MKNTLFKKIQLTKRRTDAAPWAEYYRIDDLKEAGIIFKRLHESGVSELKAYEYIPVTIIACVQSFLRHRVQELLELGNPYAANSKKLAEVKGLKFDINDLLSTDGEEINISEIIAHHLSFNSLDSINSVLSILTGTNFLTNLSFRDRGEKESGINLGKEQVLKDIVSIFRLRHIYCHEFNSLVKVDVKVLLRFLESGVLFLQASRSYLDHLIESSKQKSKKTLAKSFPELEKDFEELIKKIVSAMGVGGFDSRIQEEELEIEISRWRKYRKQLAKELSEHYLFRPDDYRERRGRFMESITIEKIGSLEYQYQFDLEIARKYNEQESFV